MSRFLERSWLLALVGPDEGVRRVVDADAAAHESKQDDQHVDGASNEPSRRALDAQVEVGGPDERQHVPGEAADQTHQDGEVRDEDCQQHGKNERRLRRMDNPFWCRVGLST